MPGDAEFVGQGVGVAFGFGARGGEDRAGPGAADPLDPAYLGDVEGDGRQGDLRVVGQVGAELGRRAGQVVAKTRSTTSVTSGSVTAWRAGSGAEAVIAGAPTRAG